MFKQKYKKAPKSTKEVTFKPNENKIHLDRKKKKENNEGN